MKIIIINPPCLDRRSNYTSAATMPLGIAYLAAYLKKNGIDVKIIDALGEAIDRIRRYDDKFDIIGLGFDEIVRRVDHDTDVIGISANFSVQQRLLLNLLRTLKNAFPKTTIIVGGNEATINYKLYLDNGADFIVLGEGEKTTLKLIRNLNRKKQLLKTNGLAFYYKGRLVRNKNKYIKNLDSLPFPARDMFPLENYWKNKKSHGPVIKRFTSIITSRGCPYNCSFCSSTLFWGGIWRKRSIDSVIEEIKQCIDNFGIREFEFEDDNMTLDTERAKELFQKIIAHNLNIRWTTPNGIRSEHVDDEMIVLMKKSGCVHLTFAPESGSQRILKDVYKKNVNLEKIKHLVKKCNDVDIKTACFFVVGTPVEREEDRHQTQHYLIELTRCGLDEIGIFPCVPYPGTRIRNLYKIENLKEDLIIGDIPKWYPNYKAINKYIKNLYFNFFINKVIYHPEKIISNIKNIMTGRQELKTERSIISLFSRFRF